MLKLPNFLIIGAARSGTTSIYHNLREHPDVFMPVKKEPHFFTSNWDRGVAWYGALFENVSNERAVGEASVSYTYPAFPNTPQRIKQLLEDPRLIYVLRNPIDRAFSHYCYYRHYRQTENRPFERALEEDEVYLGASDYCSWIEQYLEHFSEERLKVVLFEDFCAEPAAVLQPTYAFLGVDPSFRPSNLNVKTNVAFRARSERLFKLYRRFSMSRARHVVDSFIPESWRPHIRNRVRALLGSSQGKPTMSLRTRSRLRQHFEPQIRRLEGKLGRSLPQWRD